LLWVDDEVEAFFLQVQGSGRVQLTDTQETVRVAYADQNGHPYKSIGRYLVDKGELTMSQASAQGIKAWIAGHPTRKDELFNANPSYVFFKEERLPDPKVGPKGALGVPLTPQRSVAIDSRHVPLGAPVFLLPRSQQRHPHAAPGDGAGYGRRHWRPSVSTISLALARKRRRMRAA
jgi:membrane-bound lytic murein transglycosylase A